MAVLLTHKKMKQGASMTLGIGKRRGLAECSTNQDVFAILALDQRQSLRKAFNPQAPDNVAYDEIVNFKQHIISRLAPETSAVLLDPEYGAAQNIGADNIPGSVGLITALEISGYSGKRHDRNTELLPGWQVEKAQKLGASGVKLLVYYHPGAEHAADQRDLIVSVAKQCKARDMAFFLEPLVYSIDPDKPKMDPQERRDVTVAMAGELSGLGIDILKLAFPVDVFAQPEESIWLEACQEVTRASSVPWVLLSAGVDYDLYLRQVVVACQAGASGVMAGRAVWKEAIGATFSERETFLRHQAKQRFIKLRAVCDGLARPWTSYYPPSQVSENWYLEQ